MLAGTESEKKPSTPEIVPVFVPFATIEAPTIGEPSFESVTFPVTVLFCAIAICANEKIAISSSSFSLLMFVFLKNYESVKFL